MKSFLLVLSIGLSISTQTGAYAGAVSAGTGGAGRAAVEAGETPFLNPANLAHLKGYYFTSAAGLMQSENGRSRSNFALSITDNLKDTVVPTSFAYGQSADQDATGAEKLNHLFRLSFGGFWDRGWASGFGINYQENKIADARYTETNGVFGIQWTPTKDLGLAFVAENFLANPSITPEDMRFKKTSALAGAYNFKKMMRLKLDLISADGNNFSYPTVALGVENYLNKWTIVRFGTQRNNGEGYSLYSAGIGWILPRFGFQYAYQSSQENEKATLHTVDMAIPIW